MAIITISNITTMAKRIWRDDMAQAQKQKISAANRGKTLSAETKRKISQALEKYWAGLPFKPVTASGATTGTTTGTTTTGTTNEPI